MNYSEQVDRIVEEVQLLQNDVTTIKDILEEAMISNGKFLVTKELIEMYMCGIRIHAEVIKALTTR